MTKHKRQPVKHSEAAQATTPTQHSFQVSASRQSSMYVSPLPSASDMEAYDRICPGAFDRILAMAEKQQSHRHIQEDRAVRAEVRNATIGQVLGFLLGLSGIGFSAIAVVNGQEAGSIVGILTSIGSLMWSFKKGSDRKRESLEKRQAMM